MQLLTRWLPAVLILLMTACGDDPADLAPEGTIVRAGDEADTGEAVDTPQERDRESSNDDEVAPGGSVNPAGSSESTGEGTRETGADATDDPDGGDDPDGQGTDLDSGDGASDTTGSSEEVVEQPGNAADSDSTGGTADEEASRPPLRPSRNGTFDVTFDHIKLDAMPADAVFDPDMLTDDVRSLEDQRIRIRGFIYAGAVFRQTGIDRLLLVRNNECKFGPGGQAYHFIDVHFADGRETSFTTRPITVEGEFSLAPVEGPDGNTWSLYKMDEARVVE